MIDFKSLDSIVCASSHICPKEIDSNAWNRECNTANEIIARLRMQHGVLLADDTGLGKTWVAALVALAIKKKRGRVLILTPNKTMDIKWIRDMRYVRSILGDCSVKVGAITFLTHHEFCQDDGLHDLLIIDEAHRTKREESSFRTRLRAESDRFQKFLFLTATPFSISINELISTINLVAADEDGDRNSAIKDFAKFSMEALKGDCKQSIKEAEECWESSVSALKPWVIRHTIAGLDNAERKSFGDWKEWKIEVPEADKETIEILVRVDRLLNIDGGSEIKGFRGSDPRFHVGWQYLRHLLAKDKQVIPNEMKEKNERVLKHITAMGAIGEHHLHKIREQLDEIDNHPKVNAVVDAVVRRVMEDKEKVVVFCHHIAAVHEVAATIRHKFREQQEQPQKKDSVAFIQDWSDVWKTLLKQPLKNKKKGFRESVQKWVESPAFRRQVKSWYSYRPESKPELKKFLQNKLVRGMKGKNVPTIIDAVLELACPEHSLINNQGKMDDEETNPMIFSHTQWNPVTTAQSENLDAQLALFNTPFGSDVLVASDRLSEGIDLHKCCRLLVHYEFDPSPVRVRQREGRIRRIKGWAQRIGKPIEYAYPAFKQTRDEILVRIVRDRLQSFDLLLGGSGIGNIDPDDNNTPNKNLLKSLQERIGVRSIKCLADNC